MHQTNHQPLLLKVPEDLLNNLSEARNKLEIIIQELDNYLEKKRDRFARFYFLSNDDLLEILS